MGEEDEEVLRDYLAYYATRGAEGELVVCDEASLKARARRLLGPRRRGALDVRCMAERCREARSERGGSVLSDLRKALEVLELLCVNLLLSPWRKEIRSLKVGERCRARAWAQPGPGRLLRPRVLAAAAFRGLPGPVAQKAQPKRPRSGSQGQRLRSPFRTG